MAATRNQIPGSGVSVVTLEDLSRVKGDVMKVLRTLLVAVLMAGGLSVAAYGAGRALRSHDASSANEAHPSGRPSAKTAEHTLAARRTVPGQDLRPEFRLERGDRGV
jgi:hypothetical protein